MSVCAIEHRAIEKEYSEVLKASKQASTKRAFSWSHALYGLVLLLFAEGDHCVMGDK